jgi:hypothetical protein
MASRVGERATRPNRGRQFPSRRKSAWALVGALLLAGLAGFVLGSGRSDVAELEGRASVGDHVVTIESGGWFYGLSESVAWIDTSGSFHEDGWPDCLGSAGTRPHVRFGAVSVPSLEIRAVVYVDCSSNALAQGS